MNNTHHFKKTQLSAFFLFGLVLLAAALGYYFSLPPAAVLADAPASEYSAHRALQHIEIMAKETHAAGSPENETVRLYIIDQLEKMDVEVEWINELVPGTGCLERRQAVLGRIRGTDSSGAFAVDAHFDSVPYGPGASDDISGCAAMLETARALKASPPLKNDVIFIFADQEERNANGARAFRHHAWFADVKIMMGLDVRGISGPSMAYETAPENGFVIRQLAQSTAHPRASSAMYEGYKRMPFDSDFSQYKDAVAGLNVAYIHGFKYYHTRNDTPKHVNLNSLQHHGAYVLGLARQFGGQDLSTTRAPDLTYFNLIGDLMIIYPLTYGWALTILALLIFALTLFVGFRKKHLSTGGFIGGLGFNLSVMILPALLIIPLIYGTFQLFREHALYNESLFVFSYIMVGSSCFLLLVSLVCQRLRASNALAATLSLMAALLVFFQMVMPGGAYIALWPLVLGSLALGIQYRQKNAPLSTPMIIATVLVLPIFCVLAPMLSATSDSVTLLGTAFLLPMLFVFVGLLSPQLFLFSPRFARCCALLALIVGLGTFLFSCLTCGPNPDKPWQNSLSYAVNYDTGQAWWINHDKELDEYTSQYFDEQTPLQSMAEFHPGDKRLYRKSPTSLPPQKAEALILETDQIIDGQVPVRRMRFRLHSPFNAYYAKLELLGDSQIYAATALGKSIPMGNGRKTIDFIMLPPEGGTIVMDVSPDTEIALLFTEKAFGAPEIPEWKPRPEHLMCEPNRVLDYVLGKRPLIGSGEIHTRATYRFGASQ